MYEFNFYFNLCEVSLYTCLFCTSSIHSLRHPLVLEITFTYVLDTSSYYTCVLYLYALVYFTLMNILKSNFINVVWVVNSETHNAHLWYYYNNIFILFRVSLFSRLWYILLQLHCRAQNWAKIFFSQDKAETTNETFLHKYKYQV
jgi:hypothetical protein